MTHVHSLENQGTIDDLIATSRKVAKDRIADQKLSHNPDLWPMIVANEMAAHKDRVAGIERYFFELETGLPF